MRTKNIYEPYIGQEWTSVERIKFKVLDLTVQEDDAWIEYENAQTKNRYTCRLDAFRHRFTPTAE
jgi:hypothetical protein